MKQFLPEELIRFLCKTDEFLTETCELIIIGGAAASLAYGASRTTTDIDSASELSDALEAALEKARDETGISIPVSHVGIYDPPYNYLNRIRALKNPPLAKLQIFIPDQHDLALMKMVRGYENDIQTIEDMHSARLFDMDTLVERFMSEMTQVIGNHRMIRLNFLLMIEKLFGVESADKVEEITRDWNTGM